MLKKIQQSPSGEEEFCSYESTSPAILNERALTDIEKKIIMGPLVTTAEISNQQLSTNSSEMFNAVMQERAIYTHTDPVELFLKVIKRNPCCANDYVKIAKDLFRGNFSKALVKESKITLQNILLKSISLYPKEAISYHKLGIVLPLGGCVTLLNGTLMTKQELFLKCISLDPLCGPAYAYLGATLSCLGGVALSDGTVMPEQQFFLKSMSLDPIHETDSLYGLTQAYLGALLPLEEALHCLMEQ